MATLGDRLVLLVGLFCVCLLPCRPTLATSPVRRLRADEIADSLRILKNRKLGYPGKEILLTTSDVNAEQSFFLKGERRLLSYYRGAPAGYLGRGELGFVLLRNGKFVDEYPYPLSAEDAGLAGVGIAAVSFFDTNHDGRDDLVTLIRSSSRLAPGKAANGVWILTGMADGTFERTESPVDRNVMHDQPKPPNTMAEVKLLLKEAEAKVKAEKLAAHPDPIKQTHTYRSNGDLDGRRIRCTGKAEVSIDIDDETKKKCIYWDLEAVKCRGKGDGDWLYRDGVTAICLTDGQWAIDPQYLAGHAICIGTVTGPTSSDTDMSQAHLGISCDWSCGGIGDKGCEGSGQYDFDPIAKAKAIPAVK